MLPKDLFIFIQARLDSRRFPNKILKKIKNKTILEIMISRLKFFNSKNNIFFLIPADKKNNFLFKFLKNKGFNVERGINKNVLSRFYSAAKKNNATNIMRLTSDCPLIDYKICKKLIKNYFKKKADYAHLGETYADGLDCEIFKFNSLKKIYKNKKLEKDDKEHVSIYFRKNRDKFRFFTLDKKVNDSKIRITIDYPSDLKIIKKITSKFSSIIEGKYISSNTIVNYIKKSQSNKKANLQKV